MEIEIRNFFNFLFCVLGQRHNKGCARRFVAFQENIAIVQRGDAARDGQADAAPLRLCGALRTIKAIEHLFTLGGRNVAAHQHLQRLRNLAAQRLGVGQVDRRHRDGENQDQRGNRRQRQAFSQTDNHGVSSSI